MAAASVGARSAAPALSRSPRWLAFASDDRLVEQIRRGNEPAFEVVFERYAPALLAFCRHMLASREEAEDAVQLAFASAHSDLLRHPERPVVLKPWLYTIARNRCLSMLRARPSPTAELTELPTDGLAEQVEERAELRQLLADVRELQPEQRAALLLAEVSDLSHAQVAEVLGCDVARVKALVFRARSGLIARRRARETPCNEIQEQLANLSGGPLRRTPVRLHLRECAACRAYREDVRRQREMLAAALPVAPTLGLKSSVLAAAGLGGGSTAGGLAAGLSSGAGTFGAGALVKVAAVAALAGGAAIVVPAAVDRGGEAPILERETVVRDAPSINAAAPSAELRRPPRGHGGASAQRRGVGHDGAGSINGRAGRRPEQGAPQATPPARRTSPGQDRPTPPGQARKSAGKPVPPGQAKRSPDKPVPPGQANRGAGPPAARGEAHSNSGNGVSRGNGTTSAPVPKPKPKDDKAVAAPPAAGSVPAAPPAEKHNKNTGP